MREEKRLQESDNVFIRSLGSRKVLGKSYIKDKNNGRDPGAPFPNNLRHSRRNRPRKNNPNRNDQNYVVTEEDLAARDPLILREKEVNLTEHHKSLLRKNPKFCQF